MASSMAEGILMSNLKLPIFVIEGGDVSVYLSVNEAEIDIEPIDAKSGGLMAYDAEGRLLRFETNHWRVSIGLAEDEPGHAAELEAALREFLIAVEDSIGSDPACDLPCLVEECSRLSQTPGKIKRVLIDVWGTITGSFRSKK